MESAKLTGQTCVLRPDGDCDCTTPPPKQPSAQLLQYSLSVCTNLSRWVPFATRKPRSYSLRDGPPHASQLPSRLPVEIYPRPAITSRPKTLRTPAKRIAAVPRQLRMFPALGTIGAGVTRAHHLISVCCRCSYLPADGCGDRPRRCRGRDPLTTTHATTRAWASPVGKGREGGPGRFRASRSPTAVVVTGAKGERGMLEISRVSSRGACGQVALASFCTQWNGLGILPQIRRASWRVGSQQRRSISVGAVARSGGYGRARSSAERTAVPCRRVESDRPVWASLTCAGSAGRPPGRVSNSNDGPSHGSRLWTCVSDGNRASQGGGQGRLRASGRDGVVAGQEPSS